MNEINKKRKEDERKKMDYGGKRKILGQKKLEWKQNRKEEKLKNK